MRRLKRGLCAALCLLLALPFWAAAEEADGQGVTLIRTCSSGYAVQGGWVTLSYTVFNGLDRSVTAVTVSDALTGDVGSAAVLEAGSRRVFTTRVRVTEDCESRPSVSWTMDGKTCAAEADAQEIKLEEIALSAALKCEAGDERVSLTLTVTNQGSAPVSGVKASDSLLGDMGASVPLLEPGQSVTFSRDVRPGQTGMSRCTVTAVSASGLALTVRSNKADVEGAARGEDGAVTLEALEDDPAGCVAVISNPTDKTLRDVRLCELTGGTEKIIRFLPAAGITQVLWTDRPENGEDMRFELTLPGGSALRTRPIKAVSAGDETENTGNMDVLPVMDGPSFRMAENPQTYRTMMLVTGGLLAAILFLSWIVSAIRKRRMKRLRAKKKQERRRQRAQSRKNDEKKGEGKKA